MASRSIWQDLEAPASICQHLAASGLAASGGIWDHLQHLGASGSIWEHPAASGSIWRHLAASDSIWQHLGSSGNIWQRLHKRLRIAYEPTLWSAHGDAKLDNKKNLQHLLRTRLIQLQTRDPAMVSRWIGVLVVHVTLAPLGAPLVAQAVSVQ